MSVIRNCRNKRNPVPRKRKLNKVKKQELKKTVQNVKIRVHITEHKHPPAGRHVLTLSNSGGRVEVLEVDEDLAELTGYRLEEEPDIAE